MRPQHVRKEPAADGSAHNGAEQSSNLGIATCESHQVQSRCADKPGTTQTESLFSVALGLIYCPRVRRVNLSRRRQSISLGADFRRQFIVEDRNFVRISLILATVGRNYEVRSMLVSLCKQSAGLDHFEVVLVDQNDDIDLAPHVRDARSAGLSITHIKVTRKGLSFARNVGLNAAQGEIVGFPDDDCEYYPDTIECVLREYENSPSKIVIGRIWNRTEGRPILRKWPSEARRVGQWSFYRMVSSVTLFASRSDARFDEQLGAGTMWGSNEDADFIFKALRSGIEVFYVPTIEVWHPEQANILPSVGRARTYGLGFGRFFRKNFSAPVLLLGLQVLSWHSLGLIAALARMRFEELPVRWELITSRIVGIMSSQE